jgi:Domain of unknown function (DUF222)/HNH endonuclease
VHDRDEQTDDELIEGIDACHARVGDAQRAMLACIARGDRRELWRDWGARDMAHWLSMRYGISHWKALRWIAASHALEELPRISEAFASGELSIDKVVELCRFATPETEGRLLAWAGGVSCAAIRRKGDLAAAGSIQESVDAEHARFVSWWWSDDGRRFGLAAELPAASGAVVARALQRMAERVPHMPGEDDATGAEARRADALVALCSARLGSDPDPDRATVVVHAPLASLMADRGGASLEDGGVAHPETARRLACDARVQTVIEDEHGQPLALGRSSREPSAAMLRQLRYRDAECRFPGCGARQFTQAHHIVWWKRGGTTDLANLVLICTFHHKLVHEHGWGLRRDPSGEVRWLRPDGAPYHAGPDPPRQAVLGA